LFENLTVAAGDEVNVDAASEVVQHLGGLRDESVLYFPEIIKTNLDLVKNRFVVPVMNVADCMEDEFGTILGLSSTLAQSVIFG